MRRILNPFIKWMILTGLMTHMCLAQPLEPVVKVKNGMKGTGYFFIFPYKLRKGASFEDNKLMILDSYGRVLYYQKMSWASDFKLHVNGLMSYHMQGKFYLMDKTFQVIDSVFCQNEVATDSHDFMILPNGHFLLLGTEMQELDWSGKDLFMGRHNTGSSKAQVKCGVVQELDPDKNIVFQWNSRGMYQPEDADPFYLNDTQNIDLTHFNSVDMNKNGDILVSSRYFNEVIKIKRSDSSVVWRMGGKNNQIKVLNDSIPFYGQHDARFTGENSYTLFDNGYSFDSLKHNVRVLEYVVDDSLKTANLAWSYSNEQKIISEATGNARRLKNNDVLVSYGKIEHGVPNLTFEVINGLTKEKNIQVYFTDTMGTYRTYYYEDLPFKLPEPGIKVKHSEQACILSTKRPFRFYYWNTGEQTAEKITSNPGEYYVYVSDDGKRYYRSEVRKIHPHHKSKRTAAPGAGSK